MTFRRTVGSERQLGIRIVHTDGDRDADAHHDSIRCHSPEDSAAQFDSAWRVACARKGGERGAGVYFSD